MDNLLKNIGIIIFVVSFNITSLFAQINADFFADDSTGCNTLIVNFTNISSGTGNLSYTWDFGNNTSSTLTHPTAIYSLPGVYSVTLIASNGINSDTLTKSNYIHVFVKPTANFTVNPSGSGCNPLITIFSSSSIPGNAGIKKWIWDFGDGSFGFGENAAHIYTSSTSFNVTLFIEDSNSCSDSKVKDNFIQVLPIPFVSFIATGNTSCTESQTVVFSNSSVGEEPISFFWHFGDGNTSYEKNPVHIYNGYGVYSVKLVATNPNGCKDSLNKVNYIQLQKLIASVSIDHDTTCRDQNLTIENNTIGSNHSFWNFGDGTTSTEFIPTKNYSSSGSFHILYIASFNNICFDSVIRTIHVDSIKANFSSNIHYGCQLPLEVTYTDLSIDAFTWNWKFSGGNHSDQQNPVIIYNGLLPFDSNNSVYLSDTLIVNSKFGCHDEYIIDSNIFISLPRVYFTPNNSYLYQNEMAGCLPFIVHFRDSSISFNQNDPILSKIWDFGDGTTSTLLNPVHTFSIPGKFPVRMTVTNLSGCQNMFQAYVYGGTQQVSNFEMIGDSVVCGSAVVEFNDLSNDASLINGWSWNFGDGSSSSSAHPYHRFLSTGLKTISLTAFYNGCPASTKTIENIINVSPPAGDFNYQYSCIEPLRYKFISTISGTDSIFWDFGDNHFDTMTSNNVIFHNYDSSGSYIVKATSLNQASGCQLLLLREITVSNPVAFIEVNAGLGCANSSILFDPSLSNDVSPFEYNDHSGLYLWDFGDSSPMVLSDGSISHIFNSKGIYPVRLVVKDINGCSDTIIKSMRIFKPEAHFSTDTLSGCSPFTVEFSNQSLSDTTINQWIWNFGDGTYSTLKNPVHTFNKSGHLKVTLIAEDTLTCKDTAWNNAINVFPRPIPGFSVLSNHICIGDTLFFQNHSTGIEVYCTWNFGDGTTSNLFEPFHYYTDTGFYNVSLSLIDSMACDSSIMMTNFIYVSPIPEANFETATTIFSCYPALVAFTDLSEGNDLVQWIWDFGDNSPLDYSLNPLHSYRIPGTFSVKHSVHNISGCRDVEIKNNLVEIGGPYAQIIIPDSGCINTSIKIIKQNELNVNYFNWLTDDGQSYFTDSLSLFLAEFRKYSVYLYLKSDTLGTCDKIISDSIAVPLLKANFSVSDSSGCIPLNVWFIDSSIQASGWEWVINEEPVSQSSNFQYLINEAGIQQVNLHISNTVGCHDSLQKTIVVYPLPQVELIDDIILCAGDTVRVISSGGSHYEWFPNVFISDTSSSEVDIFPPLYTVYHVQVRDSNNCVNFDSVIVNVQQKPIIHISNSDTVSLIIGEEVYLEANQVNGDIFYWFPSDYLDCSTCSSTRGIPLESMYYFFFAQDLNDCFLEKDSLYISVDVKFSVNLPTAFSPNGDGINDRVFVKGWGIKKILEFRIFNENGKVVFNSTNLEEGWDGVYNNSFLYPGMYFYLVNVEYYNTKRETKKGYIYLMK